jgi:hypothetical protein
VSARDHLLNLARHGSDRDAAPEDAVNAYRDEVQREDAAMVRAQAPKYLETAEDIAVFLALDKAAGEIEPDKE